MDNGSHFINAVVKENDGFNARCAKLLLPFQEIIDLAPGYRTSAEAMELNEDFFTPESVKIYELIINGIGYKFGCKLVLE